MVLKLYGVVKSTCTQRVLTALIEKGVPYEVVPINFAVAEHKSAAYLEKQPFGKIPYIDDDGFILYESRAIAQYIAKKYEGQGTKLIPAADDLKAYALYEQACSIELSYFDGPTSGVSFQKVFKGMKGLGAPDEAVVAQHAKNFEDALAAYDKILSKTAYLAGDEVTLADLFHLPYGTMAKNVAFADIFAKFPNVTRWFNALSERESWTKVIAL